MKTDFGGQAVFSAKPQKKGSTAIQNRLYRFHRGGDGIRIAHFLPYPGVGGTEHATLRIARATAEHGIENVAFCVHRGRQVADFFSSAGLETRTWFPIEASRREWRSFARYTLKLAFELRRQRIRLMHCADLPAAGSSAAVSARLAGIPVVCHVRNRHERVSAEHARALRAVNHFVFVSENTRQEFGFPVPPKRGRVLYDGIKLSDLSAAARQRVRDAARRDLGISADTKLVGMVARVEPQKDFATLARAARRLKDLGDPLKFLIVGGIENTPMQREFFPQVRSMLDEMGLIDSFIFTGLRDDVDRLLEAVDVFVLTTHWEGLPLVIMEAMAHRLPVIATAVDGIPEIVLHEKTGLLIDHEDDIQLAGYIRRLLGDPMGASRLAERGREMIEAKFSHRAFGKAVLELYSDMLGTDFRFR